MLRSILVGLDGSAYTDSALELGSRLAKRFNAKLVGLTIIDQATIRAPEPVPLGAGHFKVMMDEDQLAEARRTADRLLDEFSARCAQAGVSCEAIKVEGDPCDQLTCESQPCDLIILGQQTYFHHGTQAGPCKTLAHVLRSSPRPVLTTPERLAEGSSIVVATDGSAHSARALQLFALLGLPDQAPVHVVSIDADEPTAAQRAARGAKFLRRHGVQAHALPIVSSISPAEVILGEVVRLHAAMLVLGAYGKSALRQFILGSSTQHLLQESTVPMFLYH